ncbi:MAG: radical SAM protein [Planctomycetota bacterium]
MNVVLVNANTVKPPLAPLGLLHIAAYLKSKKIPVEFIDLGPAQDIPAALRRAAEFRPDLIGISIRNIDSTQMKQSQYFLPAVFDVIKTVKARCPEVPIVLGGAGFSLEPIEIMRLSQADYGIVGEGEAALCQLIRKLEAGQDPGAVAGLVYRNSNGDYSVNPPENAAGDFLQNLPFQDVTAVDYDYYYNEGGMASIQTKRGCALKCNYCTYPLIEGRYYRLFPPKRVVDEMELMVSRGYDYFHFTDSIFNVPRRHAMEVCREIVKRRLPVKWHTYMSPRGFDEELADCLLRAGNDGILFGVDSCSEKMLRETGKNFRKKDIERAAAVCHRLGLEFSLNILFGSPGETWETAQETLAAVDAWRPTAAYLTQGIRVYRNTPVYRRLVSEGKLDKNRSLLEPYFYFSESLPADFSERLRQYALTRDFVFSDVTSKSPHTNKDVSALYKRNFRGPCWKILKELKKTASRNS